MRKRFSLIDSLDKQQKDINELLGVNNYNRIITKVPYSNIGQTKFGNFFYNNYKDAIKATENLYRHFKIPNYIGGTIEESRNKFWKEYPSVEHAVDSIANAYQINPDIIKYRLNHEGYVDSSITSNNINHTLKIYHPKNNDLKSNINTHSGFFSFGLDDVGTLIKEGKIKLINEKWYDGQNKNEKNRSVNSAVGETDLDNIGIMTATLKYYRDQAKKDYPKASNEDLDRYSVIYYNRGQQGAKKFINAGGKGYNIRRTLEETKGIKK